MEKSNDPWRAEPRQVRWHNKHLGPITVLFSLTHGSYWSNPTINQRPRKGCWQSPKQGWKVSTVGEALAFHAAYPDSVPGIAYRSPALPGLIPEYRTRNRPWSSPVWTPNSNKSASKTPEFNKQGWRMDLERATHGRNPFQPRETQYWKYYSPWNMLIPLMFPLLSNFCFWPEEEINWKWSVWDINMPKFIWQTVLFIYLFLPLYKY